MTGMLSRYEALVATGELRSDPEQAAAAERLDRLQREMYKARSSTGLLGKLMGRKPAAPRGVYMWGGVGRGKSMLMDLFHDTLDDSRKAPRPLPRLHARGARTAARGAQEGSGDPIPPVAAAIARNVRCLAFDEMVVNNSADAMIMSRLFTRLIVTRA
jgi:cell division protein ZapE